MSKESKVAAAKVTVDYILAKFVELMDSDASWQVKVKGLELMGKYLGMFVDQKKVNIDIKSLVTRLSDNDLSLLAGGVVHDTIDAELVEAVGEGNSGRLALRDGSNSGV